MTSAWRLEVIFWLSMVSPNYLLYKAPLLWKELPSITKMQLATHRGRMTHICVRKQGHHLIIGSDDRLSLLRRQWHYWNQCLFIFNWTTHNQFQWNFYLLGPSDAHMRHQTRPSWVQIMTCCLSGANPSSEPMLLYCQMDPWGHISVKSESKYISIEENDYNVISKLVAILFFCPDVLIKMHVSYTKNYLKCRLQIGVILSDFLCVNIL